MHFSSSVTQIETVQTDIKTSLATHDTTLQTVLHPYTSQSDRLFIPFSLQIEKSFAQNLKAIAANFSSLEARVQALRK